MVIFENVEFSYPNAPLLFTDLNLRLQSGNWIKIVGSSGAGKTTLLKLIKGLLKPTRGSIQVQNAEDCFIGYIGAEAEDFVVGLTVQDDILFGLENLCLPAREIENRLNAVLDATALAPLRFRPAHTLSGGEVQKLAIASVLAMNAGVILIDDSLSALDPESRRSVRSLLLQLNKEGGTTIIEVDPLLQDLRPCDSIVFLNEGKVIFSGSVCDFVSSKHGNDWLRDVNRFESLQAMFLESGFDLRQKCIV